MSITHLYVVHDKVAGEAGPVYSATNLGVALRIFKHLMRIEKVDNVEDFELWHIGCYETEFVVTGVPAIQHDLYKVEHPEPEVDNE